MSQLPPPPAPSGRRTEAVSKNDENAPKKVRSPIERGIVWLLILGMGGLAAFEYSQRRQYERHLQVIEAALDKSESNAEEEDVKYADIAKNLSDKPSITESNFGGAPYDLYTWRWKGLKEYKIELYVNKSDNKLIAIKSDGM